MKVKGERLKVKNIWCVAIVVLFFTFHLSPFTFQPLQAQNLKSADQRALREAVALYDKHQYREAAQQMRKVAARNPKAAEPQYWLGMLAVKDGFNATAIRRYFTRCIELDPDYPDALAHFYRAVIHYTDEQYDEAVAELEKYFAKANGSDNAAYMEVYEEASNYLYWAQFLAEAILNAAPFDPWKVQGVSSKHDEMLPFLTHDGNRFYYLRQLPDKSARTFYAKEFEEKHWRLCYSLKRDSVFSNGVVMEAPFNQGPPEGGVSITADGNTLYYSIIQYNGVYANSDIYCVQKGADGRWGPAVSVGSQVNGPKSWESQPSVTPDGRVLYFASNRAGGLGGTDIWRCHKLKNGDWSRPENLGSAINTAGNEKCPFIHADGHTLYFVSDGWQGFGGYDFYFANVNDPYGNRPTNLGLPVNTEDDELSIGVSADGRQAYFSAKMRSGSSSDIWMFDLYPAARPEAMRLCRFKVQVSGQPHDTVMMLSEQYHNTLCFAESNKLPFITCIKAKDASRYNSPIVLNDSVTALHVTWAEPGRLSAEGEQVVDAWAAWLVEHPRVHLAVECPKAADARSIYERLLKKGLRAERLTHRGGTDITKPQMRLR